MSLTSSIVSSSLICLTALIALSPSQASSQVRERVAVLHLENSAKIKRGEISYLTQALRETANLLPTDHYLVMTRHNVTELLPPSVTLEDCLGSCAVETGRNVGARWVLVGEVIRFGRSLRVTLELHDTESASLHASGSVKGRSPTDLEEPLRTAALRILSHIDARINLKPDSEIGSADNKTREQVFSKRRLDKHSADTLSQRARVDDPRDVHTQSGEAGIKWVRIEGGSFTMGDRSLKHSKPVRRVTVKTFMMSQSEVTVAQYRRCVNAEVCSAPDLKRDHRRGDKACNWGQPNREDHPINCVSWFQLNTFAKWVGGRLPSESEWEYAARDRGKKVSYPWGDQRPSCEYAVMSDRGPGCGKAMTSPICSKLQGITEQGLCDMVGNVREWTRDEFEASYIGSPSNGNARCSSSTCNEERTDLSRVVRGSSWLDGRGLQRSLKVTYRESRAPTSRGNGIGGRIAKSMH